MSWVANILGGKCLVSNVLGVKYLGWQMSWAANVLDGKCLGWHRVRVANG